MAEKNQRVILRHPDGDCILEYQESDTTIVQKFIDWVIEYKNYSEYDITNNIFSFKDYKFVLACKMKWRRFGLTCV